MFNLFPLLGITCYDLVGVQYNSGVNADVHLVSNSNV